MFDSSSSPASSWSIISLTFTLSTLFFSCSHSFQQTHHNNVTLFGDAFFTNHHGDNSFSLTQQLSSCPSSPSSSFRNNGAGRALYSRPLRLLDDSSNTTASFSTTFTFSIVPSPLCSSGDGIAFLVASDAIPADSEDLSRGHLGLPSAQDSILAVEFDTSFDANLMGLNVNGATSVASVDVRQRGIDLKSGKEITAWIEYRSSSSLVQAWLSYSQEARPPNPVLAAQIDLSGLFGEFVHVGFSASNGVGAALHIVKDWKFKIFQLQESNQLPVDSFEGECFVCSDSEAITTSSKLLEDSILGIGGLLAFIVSALAIVGVVSCVVIKKMNLPYRTRVESRNMRAPIRFSLADIMAATMGFDSSQVVGMGSSTTVYKGSLPHAGGEVAVKRFQSDIMVDRENREVSYSSCNHSFTNEITVMAGCLRHKNLMHLEGWCCEGSEKVLVYEFMANGSLDKILFRRTLALPWKRRLNIVLGVASALTYLHEECQKQIIHRDIKLSNIMLDAAFNAKLGDLGLAEVLEHNSNIWASRGVVDPVGTMGYMAPEYLCSGVASAKTDMYSFGVLVLQVGTGRRAVEPRGVGLVDWVWEMWEVGRLVAAVDTRLIEEGSSTEKAAERMLMVGLACVHPSHVERLTAKEAARMLRRELPPPALPEKKPRIWPRTVLFSELGSEESRSVAHSELLMTS